MDERLHFFLWLLASGAGFGVVGAVFGAVTGLSTWHDGRVGGTFLGWGVARAFGRFDANEAPPVWQGALVGGTDGAVFLGVAGTGLGALLLWMGDDGTAILVVLFAAVALAGSACAFGLLATGLVRIGLSNLPAVFRIPFERLNLRRWQGTQAPRGEGAADLTRPPEDGLRQP
jgi:hypothetical protein